MDESEDHIFRGIVGHDGALAVTRAALREGDVHVLYRGPPGCGKSALLMALEEKVPGAVYKDAKSLTATKLRDVLKENPTIFCIDEVDALDKDAYDVLSSPMEHGRVQKDTHTESYDVEIQTQIIAACNDVNKLPNNIQSRFRKVPLSRYSDEQYVELCGKALPDMVEWMESEEQGREIGTYIKDKTGNTDFRDARDICNLADSFENAKEMTQAFQNPDAEIDSDPITVADVKRAQPEVGKQRLARMVRGERLDGERPEDAEITPEEEHKAEEAAKDEAEQREEMRKSIQKRLNS